MPDTPQALCSLGELTVFRCIASEVVRGFVREQRERCCLMLQTVRNFKQKPEQKAQTKRFRGCFRTNALRSKTHKIQPRGFFSRFSLASTSGHLAFSRLTSHHSSPQRPIACKQSPSAKMCSYEQPCHSLPQGIIMGTSHAGGKFDGFSHLACQAVVHRLPAHWQPPRRQWCGPCPS